MTTVTPGAVEVTQVDRDAAADAVRAYRDQKNGDWQGRIRRGECDDGYMVQAFARHRIAATPPDALQTVVEALKSAIAAIEDDRGLDDAICCSGHMCGCQAATHRQLLLHDLREVISLAGGDV